MIFSYVLRWVSHLSRRKGITIRKTNDVIIASFCIEQKMGLLYIDRDFAPFTEHLGLKSAYHKT
jgi:predicted nucleic acid-binding protein